MFPYGVLQQISETLNSLSTDGTTKSVYLGSIGVVVFTTIGVRETGRR